MANYSAEVSWEIAWKKHSSLRIKSKKFIFHWKWRWMNIPSKCQCTNKNAVGHLHQRNLYLLAFLTILKVSVKWNLFIFYSTILTTRTGPGSGFLCIGACQLPGGLVGCQEEALQSLSKWKGNVLRCLVGKAARLVLGHALSGNLGTCLLSRVLKLDLLFQNTAKYFGAVLPFPSVVHYLLWEDIPALVPRIKISRCSTVRLHSASRPKIRLPWPENRVRGTQHLKVP